MEFKYFKCIRNMENKRNNLSEDTNHDAFKFNKKTGTIVDYNEAIGGYEVVIPSMIKGIPVIKIGIKAFQGKRLRSVVLPDSIKKIDSYAFSNNLIETIHFEEELLEIGDFAFYMNRLGSLELPESIQSIGKSCFANNYILGTLRLPKSLKVVNEYAFKNNCIKYIEINSDLTLKGRGCIFQDNKVDKATFSEGIRRVPHFILFDCLLKEVDLPSSLRVIGEHAFSNNKLKKIVLPSHVKVIGNYAFSSNSITGIKIPERVEEIGRNILWVQGVQVQNENSNKIYFEEDSIVIHPSRISEDIEIDRIDNLIWEIRNQCYQAEVDKNRNVIRISIDDNLKKYFDISANESMSVTFDYKVGNETVESGGCNTISWKLEIPQKKWGGGSIINLLHLKMTQDVIFFMLQ